MKKQQAFTLLELLITASITALLMLAISSLFITFLGTAYKSRISQNLRESGTNAITQITNMVRSSSEISSACDSEYPSDYIIVIGDDGLESTISIQNDRIASVSAENTFYLTESAENENYVSNLFFTCDPTPEGKKYIGVNFTLHAGTSESSASARSTSLNFSSGVATRN